MAWATPLFHGVEIMRTLAHPRRLRIIHRLAAGPAEVGRIAVDLGLSQPNVSQHLAGMRAAGVVEDHDRLPELLDVDEQVAVGRALVQALAGDGDDSRRAGDDVAGDGDTAARCATA